MTPRQVVYLRIPVNRNGFVDPPSINWSESKEQRLWNIISKSKRTEVDWSSLSEQFSVPVTFLQQQAFWLYEQELEQLKSKIQKGTMSADTITEERSVSPPYQAPPTIQLPKKTSIDSTFKPKLKMFETNDSIDSTDASLSKVGNKPVRGIHFDEGDEDGTESESESSSSEDGGALEGSMLLHRSRILSKAVPTFEDLDEEEEGREGSNTKTTGSSISNFSSVSITKSALEEAMLDNSHF